MIPEEVRETQDRRALFGYEVVSASADGVVARWRPGPGMANPAGQAHGGLVGALVDDMCGYALVTALADVKALPTVSLNVDFYRPAWIGAEYTVRSRVLKLGRRIAFCEMTAEDADARPILRGTCTFAIG